MKTSTYLSIIVLLTSFLASDVFAQNSHTVVIRSETQLTDSLSEERMTAIVDSILQVRRMEIDSTLIGADILTLLKSSGTHRNPVKISQSASLEDALDAHIQANSERALNGYRIRIFFDNSQSSRQDSKKTEMKFIIKYPEIPTYRTYTNPYFKVTVGDFRTKSEAMGFLNRIKDEFPGAFMVKEKIF